MVSRPVLYGETLWEGRLTGKPVGLVPALGGSSPPLSTKFTHMKNQEVEWLNSQPQIDDKEEVPPTMPETPTEDDKDENGDDYPECECNDCPWSGDLNELEPDDETSVGCCPDCGSENVYVF